MSEARVKAETLETFEDPLNIVNEHNLFNIPAVDNNNKVATKSENMQSKIRFQNNMLIV